MSDVSIPTDVVNKVKAEFCRMIILRHDFSLGEIAELAHIIGCEVKLDMNKPKEPV